MRLHTSAVRVQLRVAVQVLQLIAQRCASEYCWFSASEHLGIHKAILLCTHKHAWYRSSTSQSLSMTRQQLTSPRTAALWPTTYSKTITATTRKAIANARLGLKATARWMRVEAHAVDSTFYRAICCPSTTCHEFEWSPQTQRLCKSLPHTRMNLYCCAMKPDRRMQICIASVNARLTCCNVINTVLIDALITTTCTCEEDMFAHEFLLTTRVVYLTPVTSTPRGHFCRGSDSCTYRCFCDHRPVCRSVLSHAFPNPNHWVYFFQYLTREFVRQQEHS